MNLAKKLRQISNNASVGWEERFEKYMTEEKGHLSLFNLLITCTFYIIMIKYNKSIKMT